MRITVFTPTYNRAYTLQRLYESFKKQTFRDFEWVIVDDGSTDNTEEIVNSFIKENPFFTIKYKKTENGGKHRAINRGMELVEGDLVFIVDSDDWLSNESLILIDRIEKSIPEFNKNSYAGVCGLKCNSSNNIIGTTFQGDYLDISSLEKSKHNISGDRAEVFYARILRKYPFPEIEGEKFVTEKIVWNEIAHDGYKLRYFNQCVYLCEYLEDGLTNKGWRLYADNPIQWGISIAQDREYKLLRGNSLSIQYYKYYLHEKAKFNLEEMADMLSESPVSFFFLCLWQKLVDCGRKIMGKNTIKDELTANGAK